MEIYGGQNQEYLTQLFVEFPETLPSHFRAAMGITGENRWFDTVLMGRKTYEVGLKDGFTNPLAAGLIDSLMLKVNPFVMGAGIPLFTEPVPQTQLMLQDSQSYPGGIMVLHYDVTPNSNSM